MLARKTEVHTNTSGNIDSPEMIEPSECVVKLVEAAFIMNVAPNNVSEVHEGPDSTNHVVVDVAFNARYVDLHKCF